MKYDSGSGGTFTTSSPEEHKQSLSIFWHNISNKSHIIFAIKNDCWKIEPISASSIPLFLANNTLEKIHERLFLMAMSNTPNIPNGTLQYETRTTGNADCKHQVAHVVGNQ